MRLCVDFLKILTWDQFYGEHLHELTLDSRFNTSVMCHLIILTWSLFFFLAVIQSKMLEVRQFPVLSLGCVCSAYCVMS